MENEKLKGLIDYLCYKHNTSPKNFRIYAEQAVDNYLNSTRLQDVVWPELKPTNTHNKYLNEDNKIYNEGRAECIEAERKSKE